MGSTPADPAPATENDPTVGVRAFYQWIEHGRDTSSRQNGGEFNAYFTGIAEARYVIRKVLRIADEQAKRASLEPLEHQALIQIFGSPEPQRVSDLAGRLDIAPAFASRIVKGLKPGLRRAKSVTRGRRSAFVTTTDEARELLAEIDRACVATHRAGFHEELTDAERIVSRLLASSRSSVGASQISDLERLFELARP